MQTIIHCAYKEKQNWGQAGQKYVYIHYYKAITAKSRVALSLFSNLIISNIQFLQVHAAVLNKSWHILHFLLILSMYTVQTDWKANSP